MPTTEHDEPASGGARLSIGALSRATGIPVETLRTWEARYGFPVPERKPSGHRVYPIASVPRLRRVSEALARGHRAGEVVASSEAALERLLSSTAPAAAAPAASGLARVSGPLELGLVLQVVRQFDADRLTHLLLGEAARLGPLEFLETQVAPAIREVGAAWERGEIDIRHEHFFSEKVGDLLRSLRLPMEERAQGPLVVLATLPGEQHGLGLQMAALTLSAAGCRVLPLGTEVPLDEIVTLARDLSARAVAVSVSLAHRGAATDGQVRRLRERLPRKAALLVGGQGAQAARAGIEPFADLRQLDAWGRHQARGR